MTTEQARKRLKTLAGDGEIKIETEHFGSGPSSPERRELAAAEFARVSAAYDEATAEYERIVREHPELQRLSALRKQLLAQKERWNHARVYRRFGAWRRRGIALENGVFGDTWREVVAAAEIRWKS